MFIRRKKYEELLQQYEEMCKFTSEVMEEVSSLHKENLELKDDSTYLYAYIDELQQRVDGKETEIAKYPKYMYFAGKLLSRN